MEKIIGILAIYICIFYNCFALDVRAVSSCINEDVISNTTTRVNFTLTGVKIVGKDIGDNSYFELSGDTGMNNNFIVGENLSITSAEDNVRGNRVFFHNRKNEKKSEIEVDIKGTLLFNWKYQNKRLNLVLGKIYNQSGGWEKISIELQNLKIINPLEVKVEENMYLGRVIAGEELDTETTDGAHPAKLTIKGEKGKKINITIPESVDIENKDRDQLNVKLRFRENKESEISKIFVMSDGKNGVIKDFYIDGNAKTKKDSSGRYKGKFIVRVEYES